MPLLLLLSLRGEAGSGKDVRAGEAWYVGDGELPEGGGKASEVDASRPVTGAFVREVGSRVCCGKAVDDTEVDAAERARMAGELNK